MWSCERSEELREWAVEHEAIPLPEEVVSVSGSIRDFCQENNGEVKRVGNYFVGRDLGEGMFAKVKKGIHVLTGELVAIKVTDKKQCSVNEYLLAHLHREAKLLQRLRHPNIVQAYEVIETDSKFYLVQELCSKGDLMRHVESKGRLGENETRKYIRHLVSAIDYLHQAKILHRDLKLENILLDSGKDAKLIDFGLSNNFGGNTICGSPAYSAPEVLGAKHYGPEADIWSLGVNMFAMLTGTLPYTVNANDKNVVTLLHVKMLEKKINPLPPHLSTECKSFLMKLLDFDPTKRIKMDDIFQDPWICHSHPPERFIYPNQLIDEDLSNDVLLHMSKYMKAVCSTSLGQLMISLVNQELSADAAVYFLLVNKLNRYEDKRNRELIAMNQRRKKSSSETDIASVLDKLNHIPLGEMKSLTKKTRSLKSLNARHLRKMHSERTLPSSLANGMSQHRNRHLTEPPLMYAEHKLNLPLITPKSPTEKKMPHDTLPSLHDTAAVKIVVQEPLLGASHQPSAKTKMSSGKETKKDNLLQWVNKPTAPDAVKQRYRKNKLTLPPTPELPTASYNPNRTLSPDNTSVFTDATYGTFDSPSMLSIHSVESETVEVSRLPGSHLQALESLQQHPRKLAVPLSSGVDQMLPSLPTVRTNGSLRRRDGPGGLVRCYSEKLRRRPSFK